MYPANFYGLFPAFPRSATVFVAMSFDERFTFRWAEVIEPAIRLITDAHGQALDPIRVDARVVSDSILTEILSGIGKARVVFADITSTGFLNERPIRNGNVMYEVGLAHAVRLPEEVLLFRSDSDSLLFDTANVRVNRYSPDEDPDGARQQVAESIVSTLREVDLRRSIAVRHVTDSLDAQSLMVLFKCKAVGHVEPPPLDNLAQLIRYAGTGSAIQRLLTLGLLKVRYKVSRIEKLRQLKDSPDGALLAYETTQFGDAVLREVEGRFIGS